MIYSSHQVKPITCLKSYRRLWIYTKKESSAWTEVWTDTCRSRASISDPQVEILGRFLRFFCGLLTYDSHHITATTEMKPNRYLWT